MESANTIALFYMVKAHEFPQKYRLRQWQLALNRLSEKGNFSDSFVFYVYGDQVSKHCTVSWRFLIKGENLTSYLNTHKFNFDSLFKVFFQKFILRVFMIK